MSQIERGEAAASIPTLRKLAAFYNVPLAYLFEDDSGGVSWVRHGKHIRLSPERPGVTFDLLFARLEPKNRISPHRARAWCEHARKPFASPR